MHLLKIKNKLKNLLFLKIKAGRASDILWAFFYKTIIPLVLVGYEMFIEGREGVKWELGLALLWTGKMGFTHWDWDLATGNGMNNIKWAWDFFSSVVFAPIF